MKNTVKISMWQIVYLFIGSGLMFPYTILPIMQTTPGNRDIWLAFILSFFYVILLNIPILYLANKFRGLTVTQCFDAIAGKFVGKIFGVLFVAFFFMCFTVCGIAVNKFINTTLLTQTPFWATMILLLFSVTYFTTRGPGVIARVSMMIVPLMLATIIIFTLFGSSIFNFDNLKPIFTDSTVLDLNLGALITAARLSEINIILVFSYFLKKEASINKTYSIALVIFYVFFFLILITTLLGLGYEYASIVRNPYYIYTRQVEITQALERVQVFNTLAWYPCAVLKLAIYNFMAAFILKDYLKKVSTSAVSVALSALTFLLSFVGVINSNSTMDKLLSDSVFPLITGTFAFLMPLFLCIIYGLNKKNADEKLPKLLEENASNENR